MRRLSKLLVLLALIFLPSWVHAHEVRPGYLELRESESGAFSTTWKVPARGDYRLAIQPSYPPFCRQIGEPMTAQADSAFIERGRIRCDKPLGGSRILIRGLEATQTDVLVRIEGADGEVETERLTPFQPDFIVPAKPSRLGVLWNYFQLGVEHILTGVDHLLFGLLHGLGFAGALAEVGLPHGEIPVALFSFNLGVEFGQLAFIATALSVIFLGRLGLRHSPVWATRLAAYAIGCIASYWVFERLAAA